VSGPFAFLDSLPATPEEPCPYLPGRAARYRAFSASAMPPALYHQLMDRHFRRSGDYFYAPACRHCQACIPIRVPVERFTPTRSQRRVARRNARVSVQVRAAEFSAEKYALYRRYAMQWHGKTEVNEDEFTSFLCASPLDTLHFEYRDGQGGLVAVGVCDVCEKSLSSVYFYFDPAAAQASLGTYGALVEIAWAREQSIPYYYLGYWVAGSAAMEYKSRFGPYELLAGGNWRGGNEESASELSNGTGS
jgi:leucyl-tRNA---protein transferase